MSITLKIWLLMTIPFVVAMFAYLAVTWPFRRALLMSEAERDARDDMSVIDNAIRRGLIDPDEQMADLAALTESMARGERVIGVAIFAQDGHVLSASRDVEGELQITELARAALTKGGEVRELVPFRNETALGHAILLGPAPHQTNVGSIAGAVILKDIQHVDALVNSWGRQLFWVGAVFVVLISVLSTSLVRSFVGVPLDLVLRAVDSVSAGQLDVRVPERSQDELGRLAHAFNQMTARLRDAQARAEDESHYRAQLEGRMRRVQSLAAAGEVAASIAHEVGTPLGTILGRTRMMAARPDTSEPTRRDLEIVAEQTERITRVVRRLLDLSRPRRRLSLGPVDLRPVIEEALTFLAPEFRRRGIVTRCIDNAGELRAMVDRDAFFQVLFNLFHNAVQTQPSGGQLDVEIRPVVASPSVVHASAPSAGQRPQGSRDSAPAAPGLDVAVADRGPGIPDELKERIFEPFFSTREDDGGTGLGLAIVDGFLRDMGGSIRVHDRPGGGAVFVVRLPARMLDKE